jgi:transglutaminase-like putative cysteine protease
MKIRAGFNIGFECEQPATQVLTLSIRPERHADLLSSERLVVDPRTPVHQYKDLFGNICSRVTLQPGRSTVSADFVIRDSGAPDPIDREAEQQPVEDLPDDVLVFLLGSRYCETDQLMDLAWRLFGSIRAGWDRVQAIVDYTHKRISFGYEHARPTRTAAQAHDEQVGVCRDFAHLAVALCRCMNIPARYCTGYLGDIDVPPIDAPMDFSAWFQVYLGGAWRTFDARHNKPRVGRILIAVGRDATDVPIATSFGKSVLTSFEVITEEMMEPSNALPDRGARSSAGGGAAS